VSEEVEDSMKTQLKKPSVEQVAIASVLLGLSNSSFVITPKKNSGYISLDVQTGKSKNNKNAVTVSKSHVSFMISDWRAEEEAKSLGLETLADEEHKKLRVLRLSADSILNHPQFFQSLLVVAKHESLERQKK
jgi:hypothetical protein